ncbi:MAG: hypothetical protein V4662_23750 [Verrucomicrobiota bacterium]
MKTQPTPTSSVTRSLTAMALMAASSLSLSHAEDIFGSAYGPLLDMPANLFSTPVPTSEYRRGAIANMQITQNGSVSLSVRFQNRVHRQTAVFVEDVDAGEPTWVADFGTTPSGHQLKAYLFTNVGDVVMEWLTPTGDYYFHSELSRGASSRNDSEMFPKARPYNTVSFEESVFSPDDESNPPVLVGSGHGILLISASGTSIFAGTLPDGQTVTGGGQLTRGGYTFHAPMMLRTLSGRDTLCGTLAGVDDPNAPGYLKWVKGASFSDAILPSGGWANVGPLTSPYTPPAVG